MKPTVLKLNVEGKQVSILVYSPSDDPIGTIVFCHGFPGTNRLPGLASELGKRNFSLIEVGYEGDAGSEGKFGFQRSINDVKAIAEHLKKTGSSKETRALGYSMGGLYVANAVRDNPGLFDEIVLLNPVLDANFLFKSELMPELWKVAKKTVSLEEKSFYEKEIGVMRRSRNPNLFAAELRTPVHVVQSDNDEVVSPKTVESVYKKFSCIKKFSWIRNAKHDVQGNENELIGALCD